MDNHTTMCEFDYWVLSDKFKAIVSSFDEYERNIANELIINYSVNYSLEQLTELYNYHRFGYKGPYYLYYGKYELIFIYSILNRVMNIGIDNLDRPTLKLLIPYFNDWYMRDGISGAWSVLLGVYNREQRELEEYGFYDDSLVNGISLEDAKASTEALLAESIEECTISSSNTELEDFAIIEATPSEEPLPSFINDVDSNDWYC